MEFFNKIFKKKTLSGSLTDTFGDSVIKIISLLEKKPEIPFNETEYLEIIYNNTANTYEAHQIYIFLPIAFTHLYLPDRME